MKMKGPKRSNLVFSLLLIVTLILSGCSTAATASQTGTTETSVESSTESSSEVATSSDTNEPAYSTFFSGDEVHEVRIEVAEEDWADILANAEDEEYHSATITVDGETATNVGFRTKGNSSLKSVASSDSDRFSFRIKLSEYVEDQDLLGLDEFVLNNMFSDASYMREYLSYKIMGEAGLEVPLASYVNVYVNDELFGFYLMVEAIDDSYLNRAFGENEGNLYKQESGSTLLPEANGDYDSYEQKNGEDESKTDIANLINVLDEMPEGEKGDIESVLDVDSALKYIAANTVLENYDSYNGSFAQNYYLYNSNGTFTVIPWDYNMSFGGFQGGILSTIDIDEPISGTTLEKVPLIEKLLAVDAYKERYYEIVQSYVDILSDFEAEVTSLAQLIRSHVDADPSKFVTIEQFDLNTTYQEGGATEANAEGKGMMGGMMPGNGEMPADGEKMPFDGERPEMPQNGERPDRGQVPQGGDTEAATGATIQLPDGAEQPLDGDRMRGGMDMAGSSASLINIMQARVENLKSQLAEQ